MSSSYINSEIDNSGQGLVLVEHPPAGNDQLGLDPLSVVAAGQSLIKPVGSLIGGIGSLFGNKRKKKRRKRDALRNALYQAGVSRSKMTDYHSDQWGGAKPLIPLVEQHGHLAVEYLNEKLGAKMNDSIGRSVAAGFSSWKRQRDQAEREKQEQQLQLQLLQQKATASAGSSNLMKYALPAAGGLALLTTAIVLLKTKED